MKRGTKVAWDNDYRDRPVLRITKERGKLTLGEIEDILRYDRGPGGQDLNGHYAIILNCSEETCGGNGLFGIGATDPPGDCVDLYPVNDSDDCPVCGSVLPPFEYCPNCGERWKDQGV